MKQGTSLINITVSNKMKTKLMEITKARGETSLQKHIIRVLSNYIVDAESRGVIE